MPDVKQILESGKANKKQRTDTLNGGTQSNSILNILGNLNPASYPINTILDLLQNPQQFMSKWGQELLGKAPAYQGIALPKPGDTLYHGTSSGDLEAISKTGLAPGSFVTTSPEYAKQAATVRTKFVGGSPTVISIPAEKGSWQPAGSSAEGPFYRNDAFIPAKHLNTEAQ